MSQSVPFLPRTLGWLGLLPFAGFLLGCVVLPDRYLALCINGFIAYGSVILGFVAGARWGLAMRAPPETARRGYIVSIAIALLAFAALFLPAHLALALLMVGFVAMLVFDVSGAQRRSDPI